MSRKLLLFLFVALLCARSPAPLASAQYLSSLPAGIPRDDVTVRISLLGGGLGPVTRDDLAITMKAFRDSLNWLGDSIAVRSARLERWPVDGPGTATVDVVISADARRLDLINGLVREKVENQEARRLFLTFCIEKRARSTRLFAPGPFLTLSYPLENV